MNEKIQLLLWIYYPLQVFLLFILPKLWKVAACPTLYTAPMIFFDLTDDGNLSGFITLWLTPYAIGWLILVLSIYGVSNAVNTSSQKEDPSF